MKNRQLSLSDIQKDYISKEEFYQIAHICKETALWLIETGRVSAEKPKRKGFGYKIAKEEVERYLADRQQNPLYYLKGKRHNCIPYTPPQPYSSELGGAIRLAVEQEMSSLPDLLTEKQVCAILGYRPKQILDWKHSGKLIALKCFNKTYFPIGLLDKRQAEVIRLVFVDGIPTKEVAASFGLTYRTIDRIKRTAIENLAEMYAYSDQFRV